MTPYFAVVFLCVHVLKFSCCVDPGKTPTSGPFKTTISSIKDCIHPARPYVKNSPLIYLATAHNGTLSGTIIFLKDTKYMKIRIRGFALRNGKWEPAFLMNNLNCHGMVLHLMCVAMNIKYDRRQCLYSKGTYSFQNLDVNQLLHSWMSKAQYGRIMWRSETYSQEGTYACKEYDTVVEPA